MEIHLPALVILLEPPEPVRTEVRLREAHGWRPLAATRDDGLRAEENEWSDDRRRAVLLHELGHVRRRDLIGHTLARITCAVYWFHPLVWTAARRMRIESERACDDLAITSGARASEYAEHLLDIVTRVRQQSTPAVAIPMAQRKEFEGRMLAILDPELERKGPNRLQALSLASGIAVLALVVAAAAPAPPAGKRR